MFLSFWDQVLLRNHTTQQHAPNVHTHTVFWGTTGWFQGLTTALKKITFKLRYYLCVTVCMCVPGSTLKIRGQSWVFILAFYLVWKRVSFLCCLPPCMWASPQHCPVSASFLTTEALELQMWATEPGFTWFWDSSQSCLHSSVWIQWTLSPALNFKRSDNLRIVGRQKPQVETRND